MFRGLARLRGCSRGIDFAFALKISFISSTRPFRYFYPALALLHSLAPGAVTVYLCPDPPSSANGPTGHFSLRPPTSGDDVSFFRCSLTLYTESPTRQATGCSVFNLFFHYPFSSPFEFKTFFLFKSFGGNPVPRSSSLFKQSVGRFPYSILTCSSVGAFMPFLADFFPFSFFFLTAPLPRTVPPLLLDFRRPILSLPCNIFSF